MLNSYRNSRTVAFCCLLESFGTFELQGLPQRSILGVSEVMGDPQVALVVSIPWFDHPRWLDGNSPISADTLETEPGPIRLSPQVA
jgi:hypothetical protein